MKIQKFQKLLREKNIDLAVISPLSVDEKNLFYFLEDKFTPCFLLIPKKGNSILLVSEMEYERAKNIKEKVVLKKFKAPISKQIAEIAKKKKVKKIGMNLSAFSVNTFKNFKKNLRMFEIKDISTMIAEVRTSKTEIEIKNIQKACNISDKILDKIFYNFNKFKTELELKKYILKEIFENNSKPAFDPLVASSPGSGFAHYPGGLRKIKKGFMFIDFGASYKGYKSDITRTFYIGKPTKKDIELYELMLDIQKKAIKMVKPKVKVSDIDSFVHKALGKYQKLYTHSLGHGVGLDIHEAPSVALKSKEILKEGMIITIEPGIYFANKFGIRIEDTLLVTKTGSKILTKTNKNLRVIKK